MKQKFKKPGPRKLLKKCADILKFPYITKTLHKNALKCAETLHESR